MKSSLLSLCMLLVSSIAIAGDNLSLACIGNSSSQIQTTKGDYANNVEPNSSKSFIFKKTTLVTKMGNINCKWSEESIICSELGKKFGDGTLMRNININRITGAGTSYEGHYDANGTALIILEFNGVCKPQKMQF